MYSHLATSFLHDDALTLHLVRLWVRASLGEWVDHWDLLKLVVLLRRLEGTGLVEAVSRIMLTLPNLGQSLGTVARPTKVLLLLITWTTVRLTNLWEAWLLGQISGTH